MSDSIKIPSLTSAHYESIEVGKFYQLTFLKDDGSLSYVFIRPVTWVTRIKDKTLNTVDYIDYIVEILDANLKYLGRDSGKLYPNESKFIDIKELNEDVGRL